MGAGEWIAGYAAFVATGSVIWQAVTHWQDRQPQARLSRPRIENRPSMTTSNISEIDPVWDTLTVTLTNTGSVPIPVDSLSVERPVPYRARFVPMEADEDGSLPARAPREYTVRMDLLEDEEADRTQPVRFRLALTSSEVFVTDDVALTWPMSNPPDPPRLKRE